jgi:hypothetical protein
MMTKWIIGPIILAAIFILAGIIGALIFAKTTQAQAVHHARFLPPDSSLIYMDYRNNWPNYISVSTDATMHPEVEGLKDLSLSVHNQTDKILDEVVVKVDYITSNGKTYKSETVKLNKIGPNSTKITTAPDSDKGICVKMQIESMRAAAFHFCYNREMKTGNNPDPYLCK